MALELDTRVLGGVGLPYRFRVRACFTSPGYARRFSQLTRSDGSGRAILSTEGNPALAMAWEAFQTHGAQTVAPPQWIQRDRHGREHGFRLEFGANQYAHFLLVIAGAAEKLHA